MESTNKNMIEQYYFVIKVVYMMLASPLLYLNMYEEVEDGEGVVMITLT